MSRLKLKIYGKFKTGFTVTLEGKHSLNHIEIEGKLPANEHLLKLYQQWQILYSQLEKSPFDHDQQKDSFRALTHDNPGQITNSSDLEDIDIKCQDAGEALEKELNYWLNNSKEFTDIKNKLLTIGKGFRLWLQINSENIDLQKIPWEKWDLLQKAEAETGIILSQYDFHLKPTKLNSQPQILAVIGGANDLECLADDEKILKELTEKKGAKITWLKSPYVHEFTRQLREGKWDILFFSGHSGSIFNEETKKWETEIQLNPQEKLKIKDFSYSLKEATKKGLKLAIFNSCDGIGVIHEIAEQRMQLPYLILMREKLPDEVAPDFLRYFLESFTANESVYKSVHKAQKILEEEREKLVGKISPKEKQNKQKTPYPCVSWLPVIFPNPAEDAPTWESLSLLIQKRKKIRFLGDVTTITLAITSLVVGVRETGYLENWESNTYDKMMQLQQRLLPHKRDENLVVITIGNEDYQYQDELADKDDRWKREGIYKGKPTPTSISDMALSQMLKNLYQDPDYKPSVIGLDILRPFPAQDDYLREQFESNPDLLMICFNGNQVSPPPELANNRDRIGFSDTPVDNVPDNNKDNKQANKSNQENNQKKTNIIRRHLYSALFLPDSNCLPPQGEYEKQLQNKDYDAFSFGYLVARHYLKKKLTPLPKNTQFGSHDLKSESEVTRGYLNLQEFTNDTGGWYRKKRNRNSKDRAIEAGKQFIINYRNTLKDSDGYDEIAYRASLKDILTNNFNRKIIDGKIVLIGVTATKPSTEERKCYGEEDKEVDCKIDAFLTPYSKSYQEKEKMFGVYIHAHAISQILSSVEKDDRSITFTNRLNEAIWVLFWACIGALIASRFSRFQVIVIGEIVAIISLSLICWFLLNMGLWLPYVPCLLVIGGTSVGIILFRASGIMDLPKIVFSNPD